MSVSVALIRKLEELDAKTREAFLCFMEEVEEKTKVITVGRSDFNDLKEVVGLCWGSEADRTGAYPVCTEEWMVARFVIPAALLGRNPASCAGCLVQKRWIPAKNLPE